jgi:hypothetical protein
MRRRDTPLTRKRGYYLTQHSPRSGQVVLCEVPVDQEASGGHGVRVDLQQRREGRLRGREVAR